MKILVFVFSIFAFININAQEERIPYLYKGTIDKMPVTLYLVKTVDGCPQQHFSAIYKYDKVSNWLLLEITDDEEDKMIMVEDLLTGILSVTQKNGSISGVWISPDGKRVLKVNLKEVSTTSQTREQYEEALDKAFYESHDC